MCKHVSMRVHVCAHTSQFPPPFAHRMKAYRTLDLRRKSSASSTSWVRVPGVPSLGSLMYYSCGCWGRIRLLVLRSSMAVVSTKKIQSKHTTMAKSKGYMYVGGSPPDEHTHTDNNRHTKNRTTPIIAVRRLPQSNERRTRGVGVCERECV